MSLCHFTSHCIALLKCSVSSQCRYIQWRLHCTAVQYCTDSIFCSSSSEHKHTELAELLETFDFTIEQSRICIVYYIMCISLQWAADVLKPSSHDSSHFPCALKMCTVVNICLSLKTSDISAFHLTFSHWVHLKQLRCASEHPIQETWPRKASSNVHPSFRSICAKRWSSSPEPSALCRKWMRTIAKWSWTQKERERLELKQFN